jgi:O-methyltransferase involved in polyketide biosynthesis
MTEKESIELGGIQKTLLFPLWGRAAESKKHNPLLVDHTAVQIIERINYDFTSFVKGLSPVSQNGWVVRSLLMDKIIKGFITKHPKATIVDIGCGLDTTFERVDNGSIRWYDLDLPDTIALRKKFFQENERRSFISSSFLDHKWLEGIIVDDSLLFIAAGVFYYFEEKEIKIFIQRISGMFPDCEIAFDATSPFGVRMANKMVLKKVVMDEKSILKWGIKKAKDLEVWDSRISVLSEEPFFKHFRTKMSQKLWIPLFISDITKMQYLIHLKIDRVT